MEEAQFLGYLILAIITLGAFIGVIVKFTQPINDLRIVIQKLNDNIDTLKSTDERHNAKIDEHDKEIGKLDKRVGKLETRVETYHGHDYSNDHINDSQ